VGMEMQEPPTHGINKDQGRIYGALIVVAWPTLSNSATARAVLTATGGTLSQVRPHEKVPELLSYLATENNLAK
jgi:hypothetical protein